MQIMNWKEMKDSPATRGFMVVMRKAGGAARFLSRIVFKPAFMEHAQNPKIRLSEMAKLQSGRIIGLLALSWAGMMSSGVKEWNGQLNLPNVAFTLGIAFLGAGLIDMAGLGLQAIGENKK